MSEPESGATRSFDEIPSPFDDPLLKKAMESLRNLRKETFGRPAASFMAGASKLTASTAHTLDVLATELSKRTGMSKGGIFKNIENEYTRQYQRFKEQGVSEETALGKAQQVIYEGLGEAAIEVPKLMLMGPVALPVEGGLTGMAEAIEQGSSPLVGAATGAIHGAVLKGVLKGASKLPGGAREAVGGVAFGLPALLQELQKPPEERDYATVAGQTIVGGALMFRGKPELKGLRGGKLPGLTTEIVEEPTIGPRKPGAEAEVPPAKQPWEMTQKEWAKAYEKANPSRISGTTPKEEVELTRLRYNVKSDRPSGLVFHSDIIKQALSEGKPVSPEVLKDYPNLAKPETPGERLTREAVSKTEPIPPKVEEIFKKHGLTPKGFSRGNGVYNYQDKSGSDGIIKAKGFSEKELTDQIKRNAEREAQPPAKPPVPPTTVAEMPGEAPKKNEKQLKQVETLVTKEAEKLLQKGVTSGIKAGVQLGKKFSAEENKVKITKLRQQFKDKTKDVQQLKQDLYDFTKEELKTQDRWQILNAIKNVKTEGGLNKALSYVNDVAEIGYQKELRFGIIKELKRTKPTVSGGITKGKFTPEIQTKLDVMRKNLIKNDPDVPEKIASLVDEYSTGSKTYEEMRDGIEQLKQTNLRLMNSQQLKGILTDVRSLKETGRTLHDVRKFNEESIINEVKEKVKDVVTGSKGLKAGWESVPKEQFEVKEKWLGRLSNWQYGWEGFLDKLSKFDKSEPFKSNLSKLGSLAFQARRGEEAGTYKNFNDVRTKAMEIFGTVKTGELNKIFGNMTKDRVNIGPVKNVDGETINLELTKGQAIAKYLQFKNPTLDKTFEETFRWTPEIKQKIVSQLTPQEKQWADYITGFYDKYYDSINQVYKKVYSIDLPKVENYSPAFRDVEKFKTEDQLLARDYIGQSYALNPSLRKRVSNIQRLRFNDANNDLIQHITMMEHFKAWAPTIRVFRQVFGDPEVRTAIKQYHGDKIIKHVDTLINQMAQDGIDKTLTVKAVDQLRINFSKAVLGLKPRIGISQLPAVLSYSSEMPIGDFFNGISDFWDHPIKNFRYLRDHSAHFRARWGEGFERDIKAALTKTGTRKISGKSPIGDYMLWHIRMGDRIASATGSWAAYKNALKSGMTDGNALLHAERVTDRVTSSSTLESLAPLQRSGSWWKLGTMFQNETNKYYRMVADNIRNLQYHRGNEAKRVSNILLAWVVLPSLFQWTADAFRWDWKRQGRVIILGPMNNLLGIGNMAQTISGWVTSKDEDFDAQASPVFSTLTDLKNATLKTVATARKGADPFKSITVNDVVRTVELWGQVGGKVTGVPTPYLIQAEQALRRGKPEELLFSKYNLGRRANQKESTKEEQAAWQEAVKKFQSGSSEKKSAEEAWEEAVKRFKTQ